ncbi:hypothetical protein AB0L06_36175 [Spirillospora sp. NPDC052269]
MSLKPLDIPTLVPALVDGLWSVAAPADRLEHIHCRSGPTGVDLTFFFLPAPEPCQHRATRICRAVIATLAPFHTWCINPPPDGVPGHPSLN